MNETLAPIVIVILMIAVAGTLGVKRFGFVRRKLTALESIAESLKKLVELQSKQR